MSGLFDLLSSASNTLDAQRAGLDVVGQNLANVNTPGYTRRVVDLAEVPPADPKSAGRGVEIVQIRALRDTYLESRIRQEQQGSASDAAVLNALTEVEGAIGLPGASLDASLDGFFGAFATLAADPTSAAARDGIVQQAQTLTQAFNDLAARLSESQRNADRDIGAATDQVNQLAAQIATLNGRIGSSGADVEALRDQRDVALGQLAQLAGIEVVNRADGLVDVTIGQGHALVVGANSYALQATSSPPLGLLSLSTSDGFDVTSALTTGRIGGLLSVRDTLIPSYQGRLDQLAFDFASQVNALHQTGFDANGAAGGDFFAPLGSVSGAAASLSVASAVVADSRLIAASATGAVGDNQIARAIVALRDTRIIAGGTTTPAEAWADLAYNVGIDVATARSSGQTRDAILLQMQHLRDQTSGVSMDEEAAHLMRFQRAYEANARYFTAIVDTIDTLLSMVK